jgi:hypothetical protein
MISKFIEDLVDGYGKRLTLHKMSGMSTLWLNNRLEVLDFTHRFLHEEQLMADWERKRDTIQETKDPSQSKMKTRKSDLQANINAADRDMPMEEQYMLGQTRLVTYNASTDSWR